MKSNDVTAETPVTQGLSHIIRCPRCRSTIEDRATEDGDRLFCANAACTYASVGFLQIAGKPVLIDFEHSIVSRDDILRRGGSSALVRDNNRSTWRMRLHAFFRGTNEVAQRYSALFANILKGKSTHPRVLIIGGGAIGSGIGKLYEDKTIDIIGTDIYVSPFARVIADGHQLPFCDGSFDGVWIQALLEHVLDPPMVVAEIHRVLRPDGIVFAETPFMAQVHERAYDFTRYTLSGHRWLFRNFAEISAGPSGGAGTAMNWSMRYLAAALTGSLRFGTAVQFLTSWFGLFDRVGSRRLHCDAAFGCHFLGSKSATALKPHDMIAYYDTQVRSEIGSRTTSTL